MSLSHQHETDRESRWASLNVAAKAITRLGPAPTARAAASTLDPLFARLQECFWTVRKERIPGKNRRRVLRKVAQAAICVNDIPGFFGYTVTHFLYRQAGSDIDTLRSMVKKAHPYWLVEYCRCGLETCPGVVVCRRDIARDFHMASKAREHFLG